MKLKEIVNSFNHKFEDEEACVSFLYQLKWPNGFRCAACGYGHAYTIASRRQTLYECMNCAKQTTLTANTLFHKSRTPLVKWLLSLYILTFYEKGVNAVQLQKLLSVSYKTAWSMLHKIRLNLSEIDQSILLNGCVEGKHDIFMKQSYPSDAYLEKERSVVSAIGDNDGNAYAKLKLISRKLQARNRLSEEEVNDFLSGNASASLADAYINPRHQREFSFKASYREKMSLEMVQSETPVRQLQDKIFSDLTASAFSWLNDTFHGLALKYAQHYLDEFCFRINARNGSIVEPFTRLLKQAVSA